VEGKHNEIVSNYDDDAMSIENANNLFHLRQNKSTVESCLDNNYNNDYDNVSYPFSKRIKLTHEPEEAKENRPVQYSADIIVEIKIEMVQWYVVPIRSLLDTGTTTTIILR
jgi:hypothetical protein